MTPYSLNSQGIRRSLIYAHPAHTRESGTARAALGVTIAAGLVRGVGRFVRSGMTLTGDRRSQPAHACALGGAPASIALSILYSGALFCALAIWSLIALAERRWLTAAGLTIMAGTVRSTAVALVAAVTIAALTALIRAARARQNSPRGGVRRPRCCWPRSACSATGDIRPGRYTSQADGSCSRRTCAWASTGDRAQYSPSRTRSLRAYGICRANPAGDRRGCGACRLQPY